MIRSEPNVLEHIIDEPADDHASPHTVVLLHGFPDGPSIWQGTADDLVTRGYRVVRLTLPGYGNEAWFSSLPRFDDVVRCMHLTLVETNSRGCTFVGHDWGAIFGYMLSERYPEDVLQFVAVEIGCAPKHILFRAFVLAYHSALVLAWWLRKPFGDWLMAVLRVFLPRPHYDQAPKPLAKHGWLYRQAWREGRSYGPWPLYYRNVIDQWSAPTSLPFLFCYGRQTVKALRFHTDVWREHMIRRQAKNRVVGLSGGHWCFLEDAATFHEALAQFVDEAGKKRSDGT